MAPVLRDAHVHHHEQVVCNACCSTTQLILCESALQHMGASQAPCCEPLHFNQKPGYYMYTCCDIVLLMQSNAHFPLQTLEGFWLITPA